MKHSLFTAKYLVRFNNQNPTRWDGESPLRLGFPVRYVLENRNGRVLVRNFAQELGTVHSLQSFELSELSEKQSIALNPEVAEDMLSIQKLNEIAAINWKNVPTSPAVALPLKGLIALEDLLFQKHLKKMAGALAMLFLVVVISKFTDPTIKTDEALIPQKYAKLILQKPKENLKTPASGGSTQSQAQVKAIARAFQSQTVQKSIKNMLRGGISRYSVMATGRSIQSLSQKISGETNVMGTGLQAKATDVLGGAKIGAYKIGSDSGYGSGNGVNINGQGKGQVEIGLNTADASVDEGLTKDEVAKVIHSHMNEIRFCYESAILKDPTLAGKLLVDFRINAGGLVPTAGVSEASLLNQQVTQCLVGKLKTWKFPQPRGGVVVAVSYPFVFKSLSR